MPPVGGSTSRERALVFVVASIVLGGCTNGDPQRSTKTSVATEVTAPTAGPVAVASPAQAAATTPRAVALATQAAVSAAPATPTAAATTPTAAPATPTAAPATPTAAAVAPAAAAPASAKPVETTQILSVSTAPSVVHAGESVNWDVRTTNDIVTVKAHVSAYTIPLQRTGPGHFKLNFAIPPNVPAFFHGTYNLDVLGETSGGATAKRTVSMTFQ